MSSRGMYGPCAWSAAAVALMSAFVTAPAVAATDFVVDGEVGGLYPGVSTTVSAMVTNLQPFAIEVTSIEVTALDSSADCGGSFLRFGQLASAVDVAAGGSAPGPVVGQVGVGAPGSCQGAAWPPAVRGSAP